MRAKCVLKCVGLLSITLISAYARPALALPEEQVEEAVAGTTEDHSGPFDVSASVTFVSDYRDRGLSYSDGKPALQGIATVSHQSGFYAGMFASTIGNQDLLGVAEVDLFGGWAGEVVPGITANAMLLYYFYPDADEGIFPSTDLFETSFQLSGQVGPVQPTVGAWYSWGQTATGNQDNLYLFADIAIPIARTPLTATFHAGYTDGVYSIAADGNTLDWSAELGWQIQLGVSLAVKYIGNDGPEIRNFSDDNVTVALTLDF